MDLIRRVWGFNVTSEPWRAGYLWLGWCVVAGLLPLWGTAALLLLFGKSISLVGFLKNGEFVLYAASFMGGAMYVIRRDVFPSKNTLTILLVSLLCVSLLVFVAITVTAISNKPEWLNISEAALKTISVFIIILATILCFFVTVADASGAGFDVPTALKKDEKQLEADLNQLLEDKAKRKGAGNE